jgi:hypothetical protein
MVNVPSHLPVKLAVVWAATAGAKAASTSARARSFCFGAARLDPGSGDALRRSALVQRESGDVANGFDARDSLQAIHERVLKPRHRGQVGAAGCDLKCEDVFRVVPGVDMTELPEAAQEQRHWRRSFLPYSRGFALELPDTLSRAPLRRRAPFAWLTRDARSLFSLRGSDIFRHSAFGIRHSAFGI